MFSLNAYYGSMAAGGGAKEVSAINVAYCGANATVTAQKSTDIYVETADANGTAIFFVKETGTYNISSTAKTQTASINVTALKKIYETRLSRLPDGYQEVTYIESTSGGNQYINTGVNLYNCAFKIEGLITPTQSAEDPIFGLGVGNTGNYAILAASQTAMRVTQHSWGIYQDTNGINQPFSFSLTQADGTLTNQIDDKPSTSTGSQAFNNSNMTLFMRDINGWSPAYAVFKLHSMKITKNGELLREFVPCYQISNNAIGLYDLKNNVFYGNNGSNVFLKGADV